MSPGVYIRHLKGSKLDFDFSDMVFSNALKKAKTMFEYKEYVTLKKDRSDLIHILTIGAGAGLFVGGGLVFPMNY